MSEKMTCPGCDAHTSSVRMAFLEDQPCPYCHLSAGSAQEVLVVRSRAGDEKLKELLEAALVRAGKAEIEVERLREFLNELLGESQRNIVVMSALLAVTP